MTPLMAKALVRAQDVARLMEWSEEPAARVVGWGRASLNQADLALLPAGVDRDSAGLWTRAWSLLHVSGDYYAWSVKSTSSDLRALAEAYRSVLGMAVVVADDNDVSAPAWATSGQRLLSAKTPSGPNSGKRPPWVRDAAPTPDPDALDRMATEAPWAAQTGDVAAGTSPAVDSHAGAAPPTAAGEAKHGRHGPTGRDEPAPAGAEDHPGCAGPGARGAGDGGPVAGGASLGAGSDLAGGRADAGDPRGTPGPGGGSALTAERENRALDALVVLALRPDLRDSVENVTALAGEGTPPPSHPSPAGAPDSWGKCVECGNETTSSTWHHGGKTSACCRRCYNDDTVHKCNGCDGSNGWERLQRAASAQREAEAALVALGPGLSSMSVQASTTYGEARCGSCVPCERAVEAGRDPKEPDELEEAMADDVGLAHEEEKDSPPFENQDVATLASRNFERVNRHSKSPGRAVEEAQADAVVVPGSRLGASLSLATYWETWARARRSTKRAAKAVTLCCACHEPILAKTGQYERGTVERMHEACWSAAKAGNDPRRAKPVGGAA